MSILADQSLCYKRGSGEMWIRDFVTYARLVHFQGWQRKEQKMIGWKGGEAVTPCCYLRRTLKPQGVGPESTIAFKKLLPTCFAKLILTTRSALKVHEPFTNTSHYSFCKNDPHYSSSPESARALHKSRNCGFNFPSSLIPLQAKGIRLLGL